MTDKEIAVKILTQKGVKGVTVKNFNEKTDKILKSAAKKVKSIENNNLAFINAYTSYKDAVTAGKVNNFGDESDKIDNSLVNKILYANRINSVKIGKLKDELIRQAKSVNKTYNSYIKDRNLYNSYSNTVKRLANDTNLTYETLYIAEKNLILEGKSYDEILDDVNKKGLNVMNVSTEDVVSFKHVKKMFDD